jgi:hypothetical protein
MSPSADGGWWTAFKLNDACLHAVKTEWERVNGSKDSTSATVLLFLCRAATNGAIALYFKCRYKCLGKRGGGSAVLRNADGSNIDTGIFTVHKETLAATDSHSINDDVKGTLKSWRRPGAGTSNHHKDPHGKTRKHCVGLAHCDARASLSAVSCAITGKSF